MNYYIKGNAAKADQIRAAFEKLGIRAGGYDFSRKDVLFFTFEAKGKTYMMRSLLDTGLDNIILTHPDYQELELPVELKFKVGDWVVIDNNHNSTYQVDSVRNYDYMLKHTHGGLMPFPFSSETRLRFWTIKDAKDSDVLSYQGEVFIARIARGLSANVAIDYDCCYDGNSFILNSFYSLTVEELKKVYPATKEQRDLLFAKMKEAGYQWNVDKKELRKIKPHYDIANFKPMQWVLVRNCDNQTWCLSIFSHMDMGFYVCINLEDFRQCIPLEGNEKLLGTTDKPSDEYINW